MDTDNSVVIVGRGCREKEVGGDEGGYRGVNGEGRRLDLGW